MQSELSCRHQWAIIKPKEEKEQLSTASRNQKLSHLAPFQPHPASSHVSQSTVMIQLQIYLTGNISSNPILSSLKNHHGLVRVENTMKTCEHKLHARILTLPTGSATQASKWGESNAFWAGGHPAPGLMVIRSRCLGFRSRPELSIGM